jgi:hypothetical protein
LRDYPSLFAEFARFEIPDDPDGQAEAALAWARKYGVLGLEPFPKPQRKPGGGLVLTPSDDPGDLIESFTQHYRRRDSVEAFVREARNARDVLALYKAAMKPSERRNIERLVIERLDDYAPYRPAGDESAPDFYATWGINACAEITQGYVSAYCRPAIYRRDGRFERGWGFVNLLGAMWLQMYLMLTATDDEFRCLNPRCPKGNPVLPRRDKHDVGRPQKYCSTACKNQAAQIRRRSGHAKTRATKPRDVGAESANDEYPAFRRALQNLRHKARGD